jgi:putative ABC transport system permease protein
VRLVRLAEMTASGFRLTHVTPLLGRIFVDDDERPDAPPVMVIGHDEWRRHFDGDPGVIGRTVRLDDMVHTVVGVMPEGFGFPVRHRYWVPLRLRC